MSTDPSQSDDRDDNDGADGKPDNMRRADVANGENPDAGAADNGKPAKPHLTGQRQAQVNADNEPPA